MAPRQDINIICERLTVGGLPTRFEDQQRLPMGVSVNSTSYSAKLLQVGARVWELNTVQKANILKGSNFLNSTSEGWGAVAPEVSHQLNSTFLLRQAAPDLVSSDAEILCEVRL